MTDSVLDTDLRGEETSDMALAAGEGTGSLVGPTMRCDTATASDMSIVFDVAHEAPAIDRVFAFRKMAEASGRKPASIAKEYATLAFGPGRLSFDDYVRLRLYDEAFIGSADKKQFVGARKYIDLIHKINYRNQYVCLAEDKIAAASYFSAYGLPVIPLKAVYAGELRASATHILHTRAALRAFLLDPSNYPMFGKPAFGLQSLGSMALHSVDRHLEQIAGSNGLHGVEAVVDAIVCHYNAGYLFQDLVETHAGLASIVGKRLGTVRVVTIATDAGPAIFKAAWKLVGGANVADNFWRSGNMVAGVDIQCGRIHKVAHGSGLEVADTTRHLDTGAALIGIQVPFWDEMVSVAIEGTKSLRNLGLVGWDMGITDKGPVIVEANVMADMMLMQIANRTGVLDPMFIDLIARQKKGAAAHLKGFKQSLNKL